MQSQSARCALNLVVLAMTGLLGSPGTGSAQASFETFGAGRAAIPETLLLPVRLEDAVDPAYWVLSHRNGYSASEALDREVQARMVKSPSGSRGSDEIVWEIVRTLNDHCASADIPCPDLVRVVSVPHGFTSVPKQAWVNEGAVHRFYIVPEGSS